MNKSRFEWLRRYNWALVVGLLAVSSLVLAACPADDEPGDDAAEMMQNERITMLETELRAANAMVESLNDRIEALMAAQGMDTDEPAAPVVVQNLVSSPPVYSSGGLVSAANPIAAQVGRDILKMGGSAIDAAVAIQIMLTLVEPQSSGIGGGAFLLHWDEAASELTTYDGREEAPSAADGEYFFRDGERLPWWDARIGGRSVGAPGVIAMLELAHQDHGTLDWEDLFAPTIALATEGFAISPRLHNSIVGNTNVHPGGELGLNTYEDAQEYFYTASGEAKPVGTVLQNPELAAVLRTIASEGSDGFYTGEVAQDIVDTVASTPDNVGLLTLEDLENYEAVKRDPVCADYRGYEICGMGPPTSGGLTVLQILKLLEPHDLSSMEPFAPETAHLFTQAARLAYADRGLYIGDSDFVQVPIDGLLNEEYLMERSALIDTEMDNGSATPGVPPGLAEDFAAGISLELPSTTHFVVVDSDGNGVSSTSSVESGFGSYLMSNGFILNNQLTDFSFAPSMENGDLIANRVEASKRPRSSMSPMMVFDSDGDLRLLVGSPGGSRIINYVALAIIAVLDWEMDVQEAVSLPHYANRNGSTDLEAGTVAATLQPMLEAMGHSVNVRALTSGLHAIEVTDGGLFGGADPRREGVAVGE